MLDRNLVTATTLGYGANGVYDKYRTRIQYTKDFTNWTTALDLDGISIGGAFAYGYYHNGWYYFSLTCLQDRKYELGVYLIRSMDGVNWSPLIKCGVDPGVPGTLNNVFLISGFWENQIVLKGGGAVYLGNMGNIVGNLLPLSKQPTMSFQGHYYQFDGCPVSLFTTNGQVYVPDATQWTASNKYGKAVLPTTGYIHSQVVIFNGKLYALLSKPTYQLPNTNRGQCALCSCNPGNATSTWTLEKEWAYDADCLNQPRHVFMTSAKPYNYTTNSPPHRLIEQNGKVLMGGQTSMDSTYGLNILATPDFKTFTTVASYQSQEWDDIWAWAGDGDNGVGTFAPGWKYGSEIEIGADYVFRELEYPFYPR